MTVKDGNDDPPMAVVTQITKSVSTSPYSAPASTPVDLPTTIPFTPKSSLESIYVDNYRWQYQRCACNPIDINAAPVKVVVVPIPNHGYGDASNLVATDSSWGWNAFIRQHRPRLYEYEVPEWTSLQW